MFCRAKDIQFYKDRYTNHYPWLTQLLTSFLVKAPDYSNPLDKEKSLTERHVPSFCVLPFASVLKIFNNTNLRKYTEARAQAVEPDQPKQ